VDAKRTPDGTGDFHPRVSVNSICSWKASFDEDLALWQDIGISHVGMIAPKVIPVGWDEAERRAKAAGLRVSSFSCYRHEGMTESIDFCASMGTEVLYIVTGGYGSVLWEDAAADFAADIAPHVEHARAKGVTLAVEPTNPLRTDTSFLHSVRDAIHVGRTTGMSVVVDFYSAWYERDLDQLVRDNLDLVALCQICDFKLGTFDMPNRVALGDGDIPLERLFGIMLDAGYEGPFDLEILGPRIEDEGYRAPIVRSLERASEILDALGA
jgi:sugar phosphate isomerase/epimerase